MSDAGAPVLFTERETASGHVLAEARLNSESTLNSLSLDMIDLLMPALERWREDERVAAVLLTAEGERAFSAGGDVQALYRAMVRNHEQGERVDEYPYDFFEREYRLDHALHCFPKPVLALGFGVVMGGGLGIFSAADLRVVSEKVRIAYPEVTIGLFPDAGGTWMLKHLPTHQALFLGLTGAALNSRDALDSGVATHALGREAHGELLQSLAALSLSGDAGQDFARLEECLESFEAPALPDGELRKVPATLTLEADLGTVIAALRDLRGTSGWIDRGLDAFERGCPTTAGIVVEQLRRAASLSLADCFRLEMTVATHCADNHDFAEGVRALLIEKDNAPRWQFGDVDALPEAYVLTHFEEPWPENPLSNLEDSNP